MAVVTAVAFVGSIAAIIAVAVTASGPNSPSVAPSGPAPTQLLATVGPDGQVTLKTQRGRAVTKLPSGSYTIVVRVNSTHADFHLIGPNFNRASKPDAASLGLWGVQLVSGTYRYMNDLSRRASTHAITVY